jgi:20S proteasome subunit beta 1
MLKQDIALNGSGSGYIYGYVDSNFKKNMTRQEAKEFLKKCVSLAMYRDNSSGGVIRILDITKDGISREYYPFDQIEFPKMK